MPAIVRWPKRIPAGKVSEAPASQVDWFASLAELVGEELVEGEAQDSRNHLTVWLGKDRKRTRGREYIVENAGTLSITVDGWKYIAPSGGAAKNHDVNIELGNAKEPQLYHLTEDIGERNNVAELYPERVAELAARLEEVRRLPDRRGEISDSKK